MVMNAKNRTYKPLRATGPNCSRPDPATLERHSARAAPRTEERPRAADAEAGENYPSFRGGRNEEFTATSWWGVGRPPHERAWRTNAFVAKSVLGLTTTVGLIERRTIDRALRRLCGFPCAKNCRRNPPSRAPSTSSPKGAGRTCTGSTRQGDPWESADWAHQPRQHRPQSPRKPGHDTGRRRDAGFHDTAGPASPGYKIRGNSYPLPLNTADGGVIIAARLSTALMHDRLAALPLS